MFPDELAERIEEYMNSNTPHVVYEFMTIFVQRIYPDTVWKRKMELSLSIVCFQMVTPSNIVYVIMLVKNGKSLCDQKKSQKNNPGIGGRRKGDHYSPVEKVRRECMTKLRGIWKDWTISTQQKTI